MSTTLENIRIPDPVEGMIRSAQLDDTVAPENSCELSTNINFDRIGAYQTRLGTTPYTTPLAGTINAFGTLSIQSSGVRRLLAQVGTDVSAWNGAAWTSVLTTTVSTKARFAQFLDVTYMVNGNAGDNLASYTGSGSFGTTRVPSTAIKGDYISAGFEGRIWVADKSTDTLYYSDIVQFVPPSTYTITSASPNWDFIKNFSPQDGQSITGLFRVPRALLVFKQNSIYRVYGATSVDPYPAYNVGTYSQESIVQGKDGVYFHHPTGFFKFSYDSQPIEISKRVIDFVNAIDRTNYENIVGVYDNKDNIEWGVGAVTVEGVTYQNCIMRYTISTQVWTVYDLASSNRPTAMVRYDDGTQISPLVGTSGGKVGKLESGGTDFGDPIYYEYVDRWRSFTEMYSKAKAISGIMAMSQNGAGAEFQYQIDKDGPNQWKDFGKLGEKFVTLFPNADTDIDFNRFRFRIKGFTKGPQIIFSGVEILRLQDKGFNEN